MLSLQFHDIDMQSGSSALQCANVDVKKYPIQVYTPYIMSNSL